MSLFHLFSKPKVERAHGYGERQPSGPENSSPKGNNNSTTKPDTDTLGRSTDGVSIRATSIFSFRKPRHNSNARPYAPEFKQPLRERKLPHFDPPPLFQAYPQSVKDGILEVSPFLDASSRSKAKHQAGMRLQESNGMPLENLEEETASQEARQSSISAKKGVPGVPSGSLSKKMFVLVTSGYLLQYSYEGPSDRLPEKMLPLGRDSAAFASDLVPGKFYTLQVSEAIDQNGNPVPQSSSLFSKLGMRNSNAKRITSNLVLIMQDAKEMETWMAAIRNQIELAGGRKFVADTSLRPQTSNETEKQQPELRKTPSHRYLVKRDPNKVSNVSSPATTPLHEISGLSLPVPNADDGVSEPSRPQSSRSEAATIDGIEAEASRLVGDKLDSPPLPQVPSDLSIASSYGALKKSTSSSGLRLSTTPARRASQMSSAEIDMAASSPHSAGAYLESPTSDYEAGAEVLASTRRQNSRSNVPIRSKSIDPPAFTRKHSMPNVRSALPPTMEVPELPRRGSLQTLSRAPRPTEVMIPPKNIIAISKERSDSGLESPVMGRHSVGPMSLNNARTLASVRSEPNLPLAAAAAARDKRDSKIPPPPSMTLDGVRPESFLGDLPPPSTWSSSKTSNRRISGYQAASPDGTATSSPPSQTAASQSPPSLIVPPSILKQPSNSKQGHSSDQTRPNSINSRRTSTFSIPLKINPSTAWNQNEPSLNNRRASQLSDPDAVNEAHQVYSLASKADPPTVKRFSLSPSPTPSPIIDRFPFPARASTSQLASIANQTLTIASIPADSPSELSQASPSPPSTATVHTAQALPLRRPISLHVRADHAPFLAGPRTSIGYATSGPGQTSQPTATNPAPRPVQSLRMSRSASNMPLLASNGPISTDSSHRHKASPPEAFNGLDFGTTDVVLSEDSQEGAQNAAFDQASESSASALARPYSPPVPRSTSRHSSSRTSVGANRRTSKSRSSLDIGIMGLGPPAPPPLAPLPAPPPGAVARSESHRDVNRNSGRASRKGSRTGIPSFRNSNHQKDVIGLGLGGMESSSAVSSSERASPPPAMHGLGIQVG